MYKTVSLTLVGSSLVVALFLFSEKEIKRNNAFQRQYVPHALEKIGEFQLESNAFYLAGIDSASIYLGNYNAPLYLKVVNSDLTSFRDIKVDIQHYDLPYKRVRIEVRPPYFFVGDGAVPVLFKGKVLDWKAGTFSKDDAFFYQFAVRDSVNLFILTTSSRTGENTLGLLERKEDTTALNLRSNILNAQMDGTFDTNGMLLWNDELKKVIYIYYYRNQYEVADGDLSGSFTGKTIDTLAVAQLDIAHYQKKDASTLGKATLVNRYAHTYGNFLFVNSDRLGRYEDGAVLESASIIDQYDLGDNTYVQSFYFYHERGDKLREFKVFGNTVIGLVNDKLWVYRIKTGAHQ